MQITLTLDLTPENLDKLRAFCIDDVKMTKAIEKQVAKNADTDVPAAAKESTNTSIPDVNTWTDNTAYCGPLPEKETISKTDVRALALKLSKAGKQDIIKELFSKFGAEKLSDVKESDYPALMKELVSANG